jgi:hypothetical protein
LGRVTGAAFGDLQPSCSQTLLVVTLSTCGCSGEVAVGDDQRLAKLVRRAAAARSQVGAQGLGDVAPEKD